MSDEKIITEPHNPFLMEAFRAFTAEGLSPPMAAEMVKAHVAHAVGVEQARALIRVADSIEKIAKLGDPVLAGEFLAFMKAATAKREANRDARANEEARRAFLASFGIEDKTDMELAS